MRTLMRALASLVAVLLMTSVAVAADSPKAKTSDRNAADCAQGSASPGQQAKAQPPQKLEGEVTAVDPATQMVTIKTADGTHQFRASKDDIRDYKVGDKLSLTLRSAPNC